MAQDAQSLTAATRSKAVKRGRKGTPKSRTGCITCKVRHVKCDETQPACRNCSESGRLCDGYTFRSSARHAPLVVAPVRTYSKDREPFRLQLNPAMDHGLSGPEHRVTTYFFERIAPRLSNIFDTDFWGQLIPQVAFCEPMVQNSLIAVSVAHAKIESLQDVFTAETQLPATTKQSLHHYNLALNQLRLDVLQHRDSYDVALICCILFVCLEFIRGDVDKAISHLQGGFGILNTWHKHLRRSGNGNARSIEEKLEAFFFRMRIQYALNGKPIDYLSHHAARLSAESAKPLQFDSVLDARKSLDFLSNRALKFLQSMYLGPPEASADKVQKQSLLLEQIQVWTKAFDVHLQKHPPNDSKVHRSIVILRILSMCTRVWVETALVLTETKYDQLTDVFRTIIDLTTSISVTSPSTPARLPLDELTSSHFTFEMGIIAPIYFVAMRCRHPLLRAKAISLLSTTKPRREGLWDANLLVKILQRVRDIEEEGLASPQGSEDDPRTWPVEERRVVDVLIHHDQTNLDGPDRYWMATVVTRPNGPWGELRMTRERFSMSETVA